MDRPFTASTLSPAWTPARANGVSDATELMRIVPVSKIASSPSGKAGPQMTKYVSRRCSKRKDAATTYIHHRGRREVIDAPENWERLERISSSSTAGLFKKLSGFSSC